MGQMLDVMCYQPQQPKGQLLYEFAVSGDVEAVKALCRIKGCAELEWADLEGKTPLIAACTSSQGTEVTKTLVKLGANVNAQDHSSGGTPLHYAAREGLVQTVELLLAHGATASVRNYEGQTPLDVAEMRGFTNVVHILETREDEELAMALSSSIESAQANENTVPATTTTPETVAEAVESAMPSSASSESDFDNYYDTQNIEEDEELAMALIESEEEAELRRALDASIQSALEARSRVVATPSAPPEEAPSTSSGCCCIICYEAPIQGVCSPCGHMAACMACLAKIEADKAECPVCRARIDQVIKVFGVG